ncbi:hypothetical protein [Paramicrobacterium chengjingii]|uniref:hypothetical protein n=1 Tax=Paramicrobacterium chengjingii TaxID=2769067 RepID=UPI001420E798|nr:hypothetical protein [Microbacterium chengjingii]
MTDSLEDRVPVHSPLKDTMINAGLAGVSAAPLVGGVVAQFTSGLLAERQGARQHEFNMAVAHAVDDLLTRFDGLTPASVLESDEFMAAYERASRAAAETSSAEKRARLASAIRHTGPWSTIDEPKRTQFLTLVARYDDLHFAMLSFFRDPRSWITANTADGNKPDQQGASSIGAILGKYVFSGVAGWQQLVTPALDDLQNAGLLDNAPLNTMMTGSGPLQQRTKPLGIELLQFIEIDSTP